MCIWVPSRWLYAAEVPIYTLLGGYNGKDPKSRGHRKVCENVFQQKKRQSTNTIQFHWIVENL